MSEINNTLNERGERYGNYSDVAGTTQQLMSIVESGANYEAIYSNDCEILDYPEDYTSPNCKKFDERVK